MCDALTPSHPSDPIQTPSFHTVLITGGTGTFGRAFASHLLMTHSINKIRIFSRDELKQAEMRATLGDDVRVSYLLGDVRDLERLRLACRGVNAVVHAAALKHVPIGESNPEEMVRTNVLGSANVIRAAIDCGVRRAILLSSDKCVNPINLYGATKLCAERLFIQGNTYGVPQGTTFGIVRYGNVMGSRGSVLSIFRDAVSRGKPLPLTHPDMTRFWMTPQEAVQLVLFALERGLPGSVLVPHLPAFKIEDLARTFLKIDATIPWESLEEKNVIAWIGIRPGEKLHERLLTDDEYARTQTVLADKTALPFDVYAIAPSIQTWGTHDVWPEGWLTRYPPEGDDTPMDYDSETWPWRLGIAELYERLLKI